MNRAIMSPWVTGFLLFFTIAQRLDSIPLANIHTDSLVYLSPIENLSEAGTIKV